MPHEVRINIKSSRGESVFSVAPGETLRSALIEHGLTPYRGPFQQLNCKGLGICGSCRVLVRENGQLWSRRSCQIRCFQDLEIELE